MVSFNEAAILVSTYFLLQLTCVFNLVDTLGPNACSFIINQASIPCVVCDTVDRVQALVSQANNLKTLKHIIVTEDIPESYKSKAMSYGIKVLTLKQVEKMGQSNPAECLVSICAILKVEYLVV